jgi:hypothetical protein
MSRIQSYAENLAPNSEFVLLGTQRDDGAQVTPASLPADLSDYRVPLKVLRGGVFNVKDYGADGAGDDSVFIQAAIDAAEAAGGGIVAFPADTYNCATTSLTVEVSNVWLVGAGSRHATTIQYSGTGSAIKIGSAATSVHWCGIQGLGLAYTGTARAAGTIGIRQYGGQDLSVRDCAITEFETGILQDAPSGIGYIAGDNLDNILFSACKIALYVDTPTTATFARALHIVGPGKTQAGSYGIYQVANAGQGNYYSDCSIETVETALMVGGNQTYVHGLRIESVTTAINWNGTAPDNCRIMGVHVFDTTTPLAAPPTGATNNYVEYNGTLRSVSDGTTGNTDTIWTSGATEHISLSYAPGASGYLNWRKVGIGDILHLNYADLSVQAIAGLLAAGADSATRGILTLWDGAGGNTPGYIKIHSPNGTAWYLFVEDDGTLKIHNAAPTANSDGSVVGAQT